MKTLLTVGKLRGLQQCSSERGTFTVMALDHRQGLRRAINPRNPDAVSDADLTAFKLEVTAALAPLATSALLDPEFSAAQAVTAGCLPGGLGLVVAVEATGYTGDPAARHSRILDGWSVAKAKRMGASAIKLLVYYHPDSPTAAEIEAFVASVAADCAAHDIALMLEPLSYPPDAARGALTSEERRRVAYELHDGLAQVAAVVGS